MKETEQKDNEQKANKLDWTDKYALAIFIITPLVFNLIYYRPDMIQLANKNIIVAYISLGSAVVLLLIRLIRLKKIGIAMIVIILASLYNLYSNYSYLNMQ